MSLPLILFTVVYLLFRTCYETKVRTEIVCKLRTYSTNGEKFIGSIMCLCDLLWNNGLTELCAQKGLWDLGLRGDHLPALSCMNVIIVWNTFFLPLEQPSGDTLVFQPPHGNAFMKVLCNKNTLSPKWTQHIRLKK